MKVLSWLVFFVTLAIMLAGLFISSHDAAVERWMWNNMDWMAFVILADILFFIGSILALFRLHVAVDTVAD